MAADRAEYPPPQSDSQSLQLIQVHILFRHGDRSPTPTLGRPNPELWSNRLQQVPMLMPLRKYHYQERPFGHLTVKGAQQAKQLGLWMKDAYMDKLLVETDKPHLFLRVRSTNFLRTHMSAWFVLEGLLGSSELTASVPITIREDQHENLYHNDHCARLAKLWKALWSSKQKTEILSDGTVQETGWCKHFEDIRKSMIKHLDLREGARFPWVLAADAAQCALAHGDPLPENLTKEKLFEIRKFLARDYVSTFQDKEVCELSMGRLLREIVEAMTDRSGPCMYLYSGHDATLVPLSVALGFPWKDWPAYAASMCIELWGSIHSDELFVRVLYDGNEVVLPVHLPGIEQTWDWESQGCGKRLYTFEEFVNLAKWSMLSEDEFQNKCQCDLGLEDLSFL